MITLTHVYAYIGRNHQRETDLDMKIPPSTFLRLLRDCGVGFSVEEEAVLLDCLDIHGNSQGSHQIPMISISLFFTTLLRYCGHWMDNLTLYKEKLVTAIQRSTHPMQSFQDLKALLSSFTVNGGSINQHDLHIVLCRSSIFRDFSKIELESLLSAFFPLGQNSFNYRPLLSYLRHLISINSQLVDELRNIRSGQDLWSRLVSAIRKRDHGHYFGLRKFMANSCRFSQSFFDDEVLSKLLSHYQIRISDEDVLDEIHELIAFDYHKEEAADAMLTMTRSMKKRRRLYSVQRFFHELLAANSHLEPKLAQHFYQIFTSSPSIKQQQQEPWAVMDDLIRRLKLFSSSTEEKNRGHYISCKSFAKICHGMNIHITAEDVIRLADQCDDHHIKPSLINIYILYQLLPTVPLPTLSAQLSSIIKHLKELFQRSRTNYHRSIDDWKEDLLTLCRGYDSGVLNKLEKDSGWIAREHFIQVLKLFHITTSNDLLEKLFLSMSPDKQHLPYLEFVELMVSDGKDSVSHQRSSNMQKRVAQEEKQHRPLSRLIHAIRKSLAQFLTADFEVSYVSILVQRK
jgi:hypothetical protein